MPSAPGTGAEKHPAGQLEKAQPGGTDTQLKEGDVPQLNLLLKCDVQGSSEALAASLEKMATNEVGINIIHRGVGRIAESDVMLASASNAVIIGFNVRPDANAKRIAESEGVQIRLYDIIYDAIDDVKAALEGMLKPTIGRTPSARRNPPGDQGPQGRARSQEATCLKASSGEIRRSASYAEASSSGTVLFRTSEDSRMTRRKWPQATNVE